jgi:hypothetical protein
MLVTISAMAVIGWEHIQHFPAELRTWKLLLQGKILPARLAVLLVRYACAASMAVTMIFFFSNVKPDMCQPLFTAIYALVGSQMEDRRLRILTPGVAVRRHLGRSCIHLPHASRHPVQRRPSSHDGILRGASRSGCHLAPVLTCLCPSCGSAAAACGSTP